MKELAEEHIKIKVAISLRTLLKRNKAYSKKNENKRDIIDSYEKISMNADIRKATVTLAFNGETRTAMTTILLIVEAMEYQLIDFAEVYDKISEEEISNFKKEIIKK